MTFAIASNLNLAKGLEDDPEYLSKIRMLTTGIPFVNAVGEKIKQKRWILWFLNGALKKKRPDLFNQIIYSENGTKYIMSQIRKLVDIVFD